MGEFDAEIYDIVRQIPPGRVVTYGQLARLAQRSPLGAAGRDGRWRMLPKDCPVTAS